MHVALVQVMPLDSCVEEMGMQFQVSAAATAAAAAGGGEALAWLLPATMKAEASSGSRAMACISCKIQENLI